MLADVQLGQNKQLVQTLLQQVDEGVRQKALISIDQTEYTMDNKKAMALLFVLVERKDNITSRLQELEKIST